MFYKALEDVYFEHTAFQTALIEAGKDQAMSQKSCFEHTTFRTVLIEVERHSSRVVRNNLINRCTAAEPL
jgi:hypothetical protein